MTEFEYQEKLMACLAYKEMTIEECNKFFDTLKILVLEHPIVADWWVEIEKRSNGNGQMDTDRRDS